MSRPIVLVALALVPVSQAAGQGASAFREGTYIPVEAQDPRTVTRYAGLEFRFTGGRYELRRDGELRVSGSYQAAGDRLTLTDLEGVWACTADSTRSGMYHLRASADSLNLSPVHDACARRTNRITGTLLLGQAPALLAPVEAPPTLRESWRHFWLESNAPGWIDRVFTPDAIAEDGNRRLAGIDAIKGWLGGQDSRGPQAFPFEFLVSGQHIVERGRYRDLFGGPDGSTRVLVGRYQITWVPALAGGWQVREWLLR